MTLSLSLSHSLARAFRPWLSPPPSRAGPRDRPRSLLVFTALVLPWRDWPDAVGCGCASRFTSEEVTGQNQVKASVQRKIRQNIADEVRPPHLHCVALRCVAPVVSMGLCDVVQWVFGAGRARGAVLRGAVD
jgi:hypothetical protein